MPCPQPDPFCSQCVFEFRRRLDGLVYRFEPAPARHGLPAWRRVDLDVWLAWVPGRGWSTVDAAGTVNGRPWNVELAEQDGQPPQGEWMSKKADKSYLYDLVRIPREPALPPVEDQEDLEARARAIFQVAYGDEYLAHLDATKDRRDLAELLWCAFANGFSAGACSTSR